MTARRLFPMLTLTTIAALSFQNVGHAAFDQSDQHEQRLTGTWTTTVTLPVELGAPAFKLLITFSDDGNLIASGTAGDLPALGNPCHGVWANPAGNEFGLTYLCFNFDGNLQFTGLVKIRGTLRIDRQGQLKGKLDLTFYDVDSNEVFHSCCAAIAGNRMRVERLP